MQITEFDFKITDFDVYQLSSMNLLLLVNPSKISWATIKEDGSVQSLNQVSIENENIEFESIINKYPLLKSNFRSIIVGIGGENPVLVPSKLFEANQTRQYIEDIRPVPYKNYIGHADLSSLGISLAYDFPMELLKTIQSHFPFSKIVHLSNGLINSQFEQIGNKSAVFAFPEGENLNISAFKNGNLILHQSYPCQSTTDILYYTLLVYKQSLLSIEDVPLILGGTFTKDSDVYKLWYRFIRTLDFIKPPSSIHLKQNMKELPSYFVADLLSLQACG
jgi:hypothetical protein